MLIRPYFLLYRWRLLAAAIFSLLFAVLAFSSTSAQGLFDFRIFWDRYCGCPLDPKDARILANPFEFTSFILPIILGISAGFAGAATPGLQGNTRFLLTRPTPRITLILQPLLLSALALAILPSVGWLLLLGWLKLVHAPALGHLLALVKMVPSASNLGPRPSFLQVMSALHMGRRFVAGLSVGLSLYAIFASQRWLMLDPNPRLRGLGMSVFVLIYVPSMRLISPRYGAAILLWPPKGASLGYLPSNLGIALHFIVAVGVLFGSWRLLQRVEL
jgi:hypothetical protein